MSLTVLFETSGQLDGATEFGTAAFERNVGNPGSSSSDSSTFVFEDAAFGDVGRLTPSLLIDNLETRFGSLMNIIGREERGAFGGAGGSGRGVGALADQWLVNWAVMDLENAGASRGIAVASSAEFTNPAGASFASITTRQISTLVADPVNADQFKVQGCLLVPTGGSLIFTGDGAAGTITIGLVLIPLIRTGSHLEHCVANALSDLEQRVTALEP